MGEDNKLRKSLRAEAQRELRYKNTETLKRRKENQWLAHLRYKSYNLRKTYKLWCSLMREKCYRNIPSAKRCNGKSTTDLKTKILFAVVENISKLLCYYSMDDHSRFLFGWPLEEVETCPYLKKLNPFVVIYRHCLSKYLIPRPLSWMCNL